MEGVPYPFHIPIAMHATTFREVISVRHSKETLIAHLQQHPEQFEEALEFALSTNEPMAWRAVWILRESHPKGDPRLIPHLDRILAHLPNTEGGVEREWVKTIALFTLNDEQEGVFFDACFEIWGQIGNKPGNRHAAFMQLAKLIKKYPELMHELQIVTQIEYLETLSPGVRSSVNKLLAKLS